MRRFADDFEEYLLTRIEQGTKEHHARSGWYRFLKERIGEDLDAVQEILDKMCEEDKKRMEQYLDDKFHIDAEEEVVTYRQGLKDGIRLLKYLEVF